MYIHTHIYNTHTHTHTHTYTYTHTHTHTHTYTPVPLASSLASVRCIDLSLRKGHRVMPYERQIFLSEVRHIPYKNTICIFSIKTQHTYLYMYLYVYTCI